MNTGGTYRKYTSFHFFKEIAPDAILLTSVIIEYYAKYFADLQLLGVPGRQPDVQGHFFHRKASR